jgi:hypothetical protein
MFVANNARQLTGVSGGLGGLGSVRSRRCGLRTPPWIFVGLLIWLLSAPFAGAATQLPLDKPLRFGTDRVVELFADLARHRAYYLDVTFPFRDAQQRADMSRIVGAPTHICKLSNKCGIPTAFLITIRKEGNTILKEERKVFGRYAFDANQYYRNIMIVPLRPGHYTIIVESTDNANELADIDVLVELSTDARSSDLED